MALLIVGILVGGVWVYRSAGQHSYRRAHSDYLRYDCPRAAGALHHVARFYYLTFASYVGDASREEKQCRTVLRADREAADGNYTAATDRLEMLLNSSTELPIRAHVDADLVRFYLAWGANTLAEASVPGEYADAALEVERAYSHAGNNRKSVDRLVLRIWDAATGGNVCGRPDRLEALRTAHYATDAGRVVADAANRTMPLALLSCARLNYRNRNYDDAVQQLTSLAKRYPHSPQAKKGAALLIDAQVASIRRGRTGKLPSPQVSGSTAYGQAKLVISNDSSTPIELLLSGPSSKRLLIAACARCGNYKSKPTSYTCGNSTPSATVTVIPGTYDVVARSRNGDVEPFSGTWQLGSGSRYDHCFYILTTRAHSR